MALNRGLCGKERLPLGRRGFVAGTNMFDISQCDLRGPKEFYPRNLTEYISSSGACKIRLKFMQWAGLGHQDPYHVVCGEIFQAIPEVHYFWNTPEDSKVLGGWFWRFQRMQTKYWSFAQGFGGLSWCWWKWQWLVCMRDEPDTSTKEDQGYDWWW